MSLERLWTRAATLVLLAVLGVFSAASLSACGGGGTVASGTAQVTRTSESSAGNLPTPTRTRSAATVTETQSVTETRPVVTATTTETRPTLTVTQPTTVATIVPAPITPATTSGEEASSDTPAWVWIVVLLFAGVLVGLIAFFIHRHSNELSAPERRRLLATTVASWTGAGWTIESQSESSAVVARDGVRTLIEVDAAGHVTSVQLAPG